MNSMTPTVSLAESFRVSAIISLAVDYSLVSPSPSYNFPPVPISKEVMEESALGRCQA